MFRWIPENTDHGKILTSIMIQLHPNVSVGIDGRILVNEYNLIANWRVLDEVGKMPALVLGTMMMDYKNLHQQVIYASMSKYAGSIWDVQISSYIGPSFSEKMDSLRVHAGIKLSYKKLSSLLQYYSTGYHLILSVEYKKNMLNFILYDLESPGLGCLFEF